jgi:ubiquinone/menaquinone biosynthesis C-methylase UbiE
MTMEKQQIKESITSIWDISSTTYDRHDGHGIKSDEERNAWKRLFQRLLPAGKLEILDVGCGTCEMGLLLAQLGHNVTGLDLSEKMLEKARVKAMSNELDMIFSLGDAENPPFEDNQFDIIINRHVLWTLPHPEIALKSWNRILKNGGMAIIIDGVWNDSSIETRIRRLCTELCTLIIDRKNPRKGYYPKEINSILPHPHGTALEKTIEYSKTAGFNNIQSIYLDDIIDIQKKVMSFRNRISYTHVYYVICGEK